jgi:hypothetical protein
MILDVAERMIGLLIAWALIQAAAYVVGWRLVVRFERREQKP